ncbi:MAG: dihydroorotase [Actinomycetota bacterium]
MNVVITGSTVLTQQGEQQLDVRISNGKIIELSQSIKPEVEDQLLDATGCHVLPGFVDLHTHLREPGKEDSETIETGSRAGALGGYTALVAMPNTTPAQDSIPIIDFVRAQGKRAGLVEVVPSGCITIGRAGSALAPLADLARHGVQIFTDDGSGVQDPALMRRAMEYSRDLGITLAQHCEVSALTAGAVMNECSCSSELGVPGWPALAEELMVHRDIELAKLKGARIHFLHLSTAGSVRLVREAKREGLPITAEVTPHHLSLTEELLRTFDSTFKVNPPLRSAQDIEALRSGLLDGTIDAVATDHAPHVRRDKELPLDQAPPGMLGLETALGVVLSTVPMNAMDLAKVMSINPARIAGISDRHGILPRVGQPANLCVVDMRAEWTVDPSKLASKSRNTPFVGRTLRGKVRHTVFEGDVVVKNGEAQR